MTESQKIVFTQTLIGEDADATDELIAVYLSEAEAAILRRLYRVYGNVPDAAAVPPMYDILSCKLAARYFFRRGGEGEIEHSEATGVSRKYGSVNDEDLLMEVMPYARAY